MGDNDANAVTIGDYFIRLAEQAWVEEEGFSGKRPFGNSGWQHEIYRALITNEAITGDLDAYGYIEDYDGYAADQITKDILKLLRKIDWKTVAEYKEPTDWYLVYLDVDEHGIPILSDYFTGGYTKKEAELKAEENNNAYGHNPWTVVHLPRVT